MKQRGIYVNTPEIQSAVTLPWTWASPSFFLRSPEQEGGVTKSPGWVRAEVQLEDPDSTSLPLPPAGQVFLALPAPGVPEPLPRGGCRLAWIWLL